MDKNNTGKSAQELAFDAEYQRNLGGGDKTATNQDTVKTGAETPAPTTTVEPQKFKMSDGRELTADQVKAEYDNLHKDYTQKTQELSKLKQSPPQETPAETPKVQIAPSKSELTPQQQALLAELSDLGVVTRTDLDQEFTKRKPEIIKDSASVTENQIEFRRELKTITDEWNGEDGKPKVTQDEIITFYKDNGYPKLSPDQVAKFIKQDDFVQYQARKLASESGKGDLPKTESVGAGVTTPPAPAKYDFKDGSAERAMRDMLKTT